MRLVNIITKTEKCVVLMCCNDSGWSLCYTFEDMPGDLFYGVKPYLKIQSQYVWFKEYSCNRSINNIKQQQQWHFAEIIKKGNGNYASFFFVVFTYNDTYMHFIKKMSQN